LLSGIKTIANTFSLYRAKLFLQVSLFHFRRGFAGVTFLHALFSLR